MGQCKLFCMTLGWLTVEKVLFGTIFYNICLCKKILSNIWISIAEFNILLILFNCQVINELLR